MPDSAYIICWRRVTTVEIKSGYGLEVASELRMLQAIRQLAQQVPVQIQATCLAAHAIPPEYQHDPEGWVDVICDQLLPQVAAEGLADAVDAFANIWLSRPIRCGGCLAPPGRWVLP